MKDSARLLAYVERFFARAKQTAFPTVRRAARSLGWTQRRVEEAIDGDPEGQLFTTSAILAEARRHPILAGAPALAASDSTHHETREQAIDEPALSGEE